MSALHGEQTVSNGIHIIHSYEYADASARSAATGFTSADVGKVAKQTSNNSFWLLTNHSPITWNQIGELASASVPLARTAWVDAVNGTSGGVIGDIATSFDTIAGALVAAAAVPPSAACPILVKVCPGTYTEAPLTIPACVTVSSLDGRETVIIEASTTTSPLVTLADNAVIDGCTLAGANGVGGVGITMTSAGIARAIDVVVRDCTTGILASGAGVELVADNVSIEREPTEVLTTAFSADSASTINAHNISILGTNTSAITTGIVSDGSGSTINITTIDLRYASTGVALSNDGGISISGGYLTSCTTAVHLAASDGSAIIDNVRVQSSVTWDVLIEGTSSSLETSGCEFSGYKLSVASGATWNGTWVNATPGDKGLSIEGELHVGSHLRPAEAAIGGGDSHTRGMVALTNTNQEAGVWADITTDVASHTGSTVNMFPAITTGSTFYIGGDTAFPGLKVNAPTVLTVGGGSVAVEYWNGATWASFNWMTTDADSPYETYGNALINSTSIMQMRFGTMSGWATKSLDGNTKYWIRFRVTSNITATAVIEQMKLHTSRTEINRDGFLELFGDARKERTILIDPNLFEPAGSSPGNQDIAYSTNIIIGKKENSYADNQAQQNGTNIQIPVDTDTSLPLALEIEWQPDGAGSGNVEWEVYYTTYSPTATLATALPGPLSETLSTDISPAPGVTSKGVVSTHTISIPGAIPTNGDSIALMIKRDATAGNADDTYAGAAIIRGIRLHRSIWRI